MYDITNTGSTLILKMDSWNRIQNYFPNQGLNDMTYELAPDVTNISLYDKIAYFYNIVLFLSGHKN